MVRSIFLARIHFTDESGSKLRPILLIKKNSYGDYLFFPLTSNVKSEGVLIDNNNIEKGYLPKQSKIIIEKIGIIAPDLLIKRVAIINQNTFNSVLDHFINFFKSKK